MSRHTPEKRHQASHDIDKGCCDMMRCVLAATESAFVIGAQDELVAVRDALDALHKVANKAHDTAIREMK
ncbi:hypothetical protein QF001_000861 [Paraburkholderia youngii]|uniref:hypothetical protein n=1 Tax=Paraburkholderia youngii TaxID=2782701 RepID=UPI003D1CFCE2